MSVSHIAVSGYGTHIPTYVYATYTQTLTFRYVRSHMHIHTYMHVRLHTYINMLAPTRKTAQSAEVVEYTYYFSAKG